ncbi:hypothetical protein IMSAGC009_01019 [Lachnospiraceae bacterium]|nr:hypothetical protein IMSAGC009_01019 [Lachnospiraceae bacterium]
MNPSGGTVHILPQKRPHKQQASYESGRSPRSMGCQKTVINDTYTNHRQKSCQRTPYLHFHIGYAKLRVAKSKQGMYCGTDQSNYCHQRYHSPGDFRPMDSVHGHSCRNRITHFPHRCFQRLFFPHSLLPESKSLIIYVHPDLIPHHGPRFCTANLVCQNLNVFFPVHDAPPRLRRPVL